MIYRLYRSFLTLSIISCALSVSLSQLFLLFTFICYLILPGRKKVHGPIIQVLCLFYGWQLLGVCYHWGVSGFSFSYLAQAFRGEMKDIFLTMAFFSVLGIKKEDETYLTKVFLWFSLIIVFTGFVSIFSITRLSRIVSDLYKTSTNWPYQHHYGNIGPISLYLPIGFMNTHLTFGGLIAFIFPSFFFGLYEKVLQKKPKTGIFFSFLIFSILCFVYLFNNARSAILGSVISSLFGIYVWIVLEKKISPRLIKRISIAFFILIVLGIVSYQFVNPLQKAIKPLFGNQKHTDTGRTFIWDSSFPLIQNNPIFGVGPGNYSNEIEISRKNLSKQHEELAYFYEVTQRGHAHNDYFHLAAVYGLPQVTLYLALFLTIFYILLQFPPNNELRFFGYSLIGFFFSGLLQCYFQDDEVLIVFFFILGVLQRSYQLSIEADVRRFP